MTTMEKAIARLEFSEDEDNGEIFDVGADFDHWEKTHDLRYPMPKDTLWGSELILGTILDSKNPAMLEQFNYFPTKKELHGKTRPSSPPPPPPPPPSPTLKRSPLTQGSPPGLPKLSEEKLLHELVLKEMDMKMYEIGEHENRHSYNKSNLTEGTMFDIIEKPVRTTVDNFQHEWTVSVNDYSTKRLRKLKQDLNMSDDCSDLTTGTYLESLFTPRVDCEKRNLWRDPSLPVSRTQSDISFHEETKNI